MAPSATSVAVANSGAPGPDGLRRTHRYPAEEFTGRVEAARQTCDDERVPLSEDEQRILRQIELDLQSDPTFSERGYRVSRGRLVLLGIGLVVGLGLTVVSLTISPWLAFGIFVVTFVLAVLLEQEVRVIGREKIGSLPINAWLSGQPGQRPRPHDDA